MLIEAVFIGAIALQTPFSGACGRKVVEVQILSSAPSKQHNQNELTNIPATSCDAGACGRAVQICNSARAAHATASSAASQIETSDRPPLTTAVAAVRAASQAQGWQVECLTVRRQDGAWTPASCHGAHGAPLPGGTMTEVVHTHPSGLSLSIADLELLARGDVQRVTAVSRTRVYSAQRGPHFGELRTVFVKVHGKAFADAVGRSRFTTHQADVDDLTNRALAQAGIIRYTIRSCRN